MRSHADAHAHPAPSSAFAGYRFPPESHHAGGPLVPFLSPRRNTQAPRRLFAQAISRTRVSPTEVITDRYRVYPRVLDELLPAAFHRTEAHANNPLETDHGRLIAPPTDARAKA